MAEELNVTQSAKVKGPELVVERRQDASTEALDITRKDQAVYHEFEPPVRVFGVLEKAVVNDRNRTESRLVTREFDTDNIPTLSTHTVPGEGQADEVRVSKTTVDISAGIPALVGDGKTLQLSITDIDGIHGQRIERSALNWLVFVDYEEEPETGARVTVTRTILESAPSAPSTNVAGISVSIKRIDRYRWLKVERTVNTTDMTSLTVIERHGTRFYFPSYLDPDEPFIDLLADPAGSPSSTPTATSRSFIVANRSGDLEAVVPTEYHITYHTTLPAEIAVFQFLTIDIKLRSPEMNIYEPRVITDGGTLIITYGTSEITYTFPASFPTATNYLDTIMGSVQNIAQDVTKWKFNLYRQVVVKMRMPDLTLDLSGGLTY